MDILGIGPTELVFIILIALILLGPKDMQKTGRTIGRWLRNMTTSDGWRAFRDTSREIRNLPNRLMREANLEDLEKDVGKIGKEIQDAADIKGYGAWTNQAKANPKPPQSKPVADEAPKSVNWASKPTPPSDKETNKEATEEPKENA
jgi:sec-independent protein translocase protein TatB